MTWLGFPYSTADQMQRLNSATASNLAAQESLQQAGEQTAASAKRTRRDAVMARRQAQLAARELREQPLKTSEVRCLVEEMLTRMDKSAGHRAENRH